MSRGWGIHVQRRPKSSEGGIGGKGHVQREGRRLFGRGGGLIQGAM